MGTRVALVEDHGLIAHTLSSALAARGHQVVPIDPATDTDLVAQVASTGAELVLLDLDLGPRGEATPLILDRARARWRGVVSGSCSSCVGRGPVIGPATARRH